MNTKFLKWALPAFMLTVAGAHSVEATIPGKTSYGARLGYQNMSLNGKGLLGGTDTGLFRVPIKTMGGNYGGAAGDLFISHDVDFGGNLCFGIEGYLGGSNMDTGHITHDLTTFGDRLFATHTVVKKDYTFGGRLKLGRYVKNNVLLYASLGVENTRFKVEQSATSEDILGSSSAHSLWAWVPGVGVKWKLRGNWCCQIEGTYAMYDTFSREVSGSLIPAAYTYKLNMRPTVVGLSVGFSRPF